MVNRFSGLPAVLYFLFFIREWKTAKAIIFYIVFISFGFDFGIYIFIKYFYPNSYIGSNWWVITNYFLMSWCFMKILPEKIKLIKLLIALFVALTVPSFIFLYSFYEHNVITTTFSGVVFITFSVLGYLKLLNKSNVQLSKAPSFYLITAFFGYYSFTFLKNLFVKYLVFDLGITAEQYTPISVINLLANTSKNYLLFYVLVLLHMDRYDPLLNPSKDFE